MSIAGVAVLQNKPGGNDTTAIIVYNLPKAEFMKKIVISLFVLFIVIGISANADILQSPFIPEEFDVDIFQFPHMKLIENPDSEQVDTHYTFTDEKSSYQLRYTFFKQTVKDYKNIKQAYIPCIFMVIWNAAGYEADDITHFKDSDVKSEFNGDFGTTVFIMNPKSDFGEGFDYIMMNFFYKNNQGIVVQSILFNEPEFLMNKNFLEIFHSFKFHE